PSELCNLLNKDPASPFHTLIRRESDPPQSHSVVTDTSLIEAIKSNLKAPLGALAQYRNGGGGADTESIYRALLTYWSAVKDAFPHAWAKHPTKSRLMHSAGIRAVGALMDPIMLRADSSQSPDAEIRLSLKRLAPHCRWTEGVWDHLQWRWNEVQNTAKSINKLTDYLSRLDRRLSRRGTCDLFMPTAWITSIQDTTSLRVAMHLIAIVTGTTPTRTKSWAMPLMTDCSCHEGLLATTE